MGNNAQMKEQGFSAEAYQSPEAEIIQCEGQNPENSQYKELMERVLKGEIGVNSFAHQESTKITTLIQKEEELRHSYHQEEEPDQEEDPEVVDHDKENRYASINRVPVLDLSGKQSLLKRRSYLSDYSNNRDSLQTIRESTNANDQNEEGEDGEQNFCKTL